jgi:nucleoside-diphosphate kinase
MVKTLILVKPDAVKRGLVGAILARFERRGLEIIGLKLFCPWRALLEDHYDEHRDRPFFYELIDMMSEGPLVACVVGGEGAVETARALLGDFRSPVPGTIRGDWQTAPMYNVAHASADPEAAAREIPLWFKSPELIGGF